MLRLRTSNKRRISVTERYREDGGAITLSMAYWKNHMLIFVMGANQTPKEERQVNIDIDDFKDMSNKEAVDMIVKKANDMASKFGLSTDRELEKRISVAVDEMKKGIVPVRNHTMFDRMFAYKRTTSRFTPRNKFAGKRNFRAADGGMYVIENVEKMVQEDSYNEGAIGREMWTDVYGTYRGLTITDVIHDLADTLGIDFKDIESSLFIREDGDCSFSIEENEDGMQPSSYEWEQFEKGEINLYITDYFFDINRISPKVTGEEIAKVFPKADRDF